MKSKPGTYAIIFKNDCTANVQIGQWGQIKIKPGYYIYVGSAFGGGGVRARVLHHYRRNKHNHWHIDYLREFMNPGIVWYTHEINHLEHKWANSFNKMKAISAIPRFGCSDCKCYSHLFYSSNKPDLDIFINRVGGEVYSWSKKTTG